MGNDRVNALFSAMDPDLADRLGQYPGNAEHLERLCLLFGAEGSERPIALVGAEVSSPLPGWQSLLHILGETAISRGTATPDEIKAIAARVADHPLEAASRLFETLGGRELALPELLRIYQLPGNRPRENHRFVMRLPFKAFATTNYDVGLSYAWLEEHGGTGALPSVATHEDHDVVKQWRHEWFFASAVAPIMHLHGSIEQPASMVLDEAAYDALYRPGSPFHHMFEELWLKHRLVLLGFSGTDPVIRYIARMTMESLRWPGTEPEHVAILPLEPGRTEEGVRIRRELYTHFRAHVVFYDPGGATPHQDFAGLLRALAVRHPGPSARRREALLPAAAAAYRSSAAARLRRALEQRVPKTEAAVSCEPIDHLFWVPTLTRVSVGASSVAGVIELDSGLRGRTLPRAVSPPGPGIQAQPEQIPGGEKVIVVRGEAGAGKSVLARLLALGLLEGTGVVGGLPAWLGARDLPVLVDLKRYAADLLSSADPVEAVRHCVLAATGPRSDTLLESPMFAERGLLVLDGMEALLWPAWNDVRNGWEGCDGAPPHPTALILRELLTGFPGLPRVVAVRHFGDEWLTRVGVEHVSFELSPPSPEDVRQIATVHLSGRRFGEPADGDDPRLGALLHNRHLRRFATSPLLVKLALEVDAADLTPDWIFGQLYDQLLLRGRVDSEEPLPVQDRQLRDLPRKIAYRLVSSGRATLSPDELVAAGADSGLREEPARRAAAWLAHRTDLIALGSGGEVGFTHDVHQETFAAEELAMRHSVSETVALTAVERWHEPVKYAAGVVPPDVAVELIEGLLDRGEPTLARDAWLQAGSRLPQPEGDALLERLYTLLLADLSTRADLVTAASELDTPAARQLLLEVALPLRPVSWSDTFESYARHPWAPNPPADTAEQVHRDRVALSDHLLVAESWFDQAWLFIGYAGEVGGFGGAWASASVCVAIDREAVPHHIRNSMLDILMVIEKLDHDVMRAVAEAVLQHSEAPDSLKLVALGLLAERLCADAERTQEAVRKTVELVLRALRDVARSEAPAFTIGLANALLTRAGLEHVELRAELSAVRHAAILEYGKHVVEFFRRIDGKDGYWTDPASSRADEGPLPPRTGEVAQRIRAALRGVAEEPPVPSPPAPWKARSLADAYIAASGHEVHKLKAKDTTGRWAYYFVLVTKDRERGFLEAIEGSGTIDLELHGNVVASNYGEGPTQEVRDFLKEKYGLVV
jgi:hypothetical protein